mmetsp:Transcript_39476/g.123511  ORF Transcript_39476/g.123511 Transcript_39476/m.123511 type:complete len:280 (+) Transcript_39476:508-1347(+)
MVVLDDLELLLELHELRADLLKLVVDVLLLPIHAPHGVVQMLPDARQLLHRAAEAPRDGVLVLARERDMLPPVTARDAGLALVHELELGTHALQFCLPLYWVHFGLEHLVRAIHAVKGSVRRPLRVMEGAGFFLHLDLELVLDVAHIGVVINICLLRRSLVIVHGPLKAEVPRLERLIREKIEHGTRLLAAARAKFVGREVQVEAQAPQREHELINGRLRVVELLHDEGRRVARDVCDEPVAQVCERLELQRRVVCRDREEGAMKRLDAARLAEPLLIV